MNRVVDWFKHQFSNPQILFLAFILLGLILAISFAENTFAPVFAGVVIAYLLEGVIARMTYVGVPRNLAVWLVFLSFLIVLASIVFGLLPVLYNQLSELVQQIPAMLGRGQDALLTLPERYPELLSPEQVNEIIASVRAELTSMGQNLVTSSISRAVSMITLMIYVILLPILIFFFLMDKERILEWISHMLPEERELATTVWSDVDVQIANYIRGKFWEILIVWLVTLVTFSLLDLQYALLLSFLVGISVLIPYVGAAVVTIPVVLVAWFQWGPTSEFVTVVVAYLIIQALDGNLLVPLLFSEVVNIHPVAIIVAVLFFGGLWGIWGIFFAIPLATLVQAIIVAWPKGPEEKAAAS